MNETFDKKTGYVIFALILLLLVSVYMTYLLTKNSTEKKVLEKIEKQFKVCNNACGDLQGIFVDVKDGSASCLCVEIADDTTKNNNSFQAEDNKNI